MAWHSTHYSSPGSLNARHHQTAHHGSHVTAERDGTSLHAMASAAQRTADHSLTHSAKHCTTHSKQHAAQTQRSGPVSSRRSTSWKSQTANKHASAISHFTLQVVGRTHMDELAYSLMGQHAHYGTAHSKSLHEAHH
jgi:hypothetical protein